MEAFHAMTRASDGPPRPVLVGGPNAALLRSAALWPRQAPDSVPPVQDGAALVAEARHHGLLPALQRSLSGRFPDAALPGLREGCRQAGLRALRQAVATRRLLAALRDAGIDALVVKGLALSQLLYGAHDLRPSIDIDLLVPPGRVQEAHRILLACGYAQAGAAPVGQLGRLTKDAMYRGDGGIVELHWRLVRNDTVLRWDFETLWAGRETVTVLGVEMPTLSRPHYAVFLALHGVHHGWERLRWLADVALLLWEPAEAGRALAQAAEDGARPVLLHALALAHAEFGMPLAPEHRAEWLGCRRARALDRFVAGWNRQRQAGLRGRPSILAVPLEKWRQRRADFLICPTAASRLEEVRILFRSPADRDFLLLPAALGWLYPVLRPGFLAARMVSGYWKARHPRQNISR